jgi:hypothetical protein
VSRPGVFQDATVQSWSERRLIHKCRLIPTFNRFSLFWSDRSYPTCRSQPGHVPQAGLPRRDMTQHDEARFAATAGSSKYPRRGLLVRSASSGALSSFPLSCSSVASSGLDGLSTQWSVATRVLRPAPSTSGTLNPPNCAGALSRQNGLTEDSSVMRRDKAARGAKHGK